MAGGFVTYLYLLDPVSYESSPAYEYLGASIPTAIVAGVIYALVTLFFVRPAGKGGY